jgi:hypothetical protein
MTNSVKSSSSSDPDSSVLGEIATLPKVREAPKGWVKVGAIAAASAVLGGLAAAWFYRKTLSQLQEAGDGITDSLPKAIADETEEDF